jgi:hypothetical protein
MDQMLPTPRQELPAPERQSPMQNGGEYVVPYPEELEQKAPGERIAQAASAVAQVADPVVIPMVTDPIGSDDTTVVDPSQVTNPLVADDVDVIEKEWVAKAKDIVAKTKNDPHQQSVQLTVFKHDYMKKRYGKDIKTPNDRSV